MTRTLPHAGRLLPAVAALAAVVLVAAGCGSGDDEASTTTQAADVAYADGLCGAISSWKTTVGSARTTLQNRDELSKAKLQEVASNVSDANAKLKDDVEALGSPPQSAGP